MIYINNGEIKLPEGWKKKADEVTHELVNATDSKERKKIIDDNKKLWGILKEALLELSHNKCWYTEARNDSSHFEVEHFRPKRWHNDPENPNFDGYWWLAFDWKNFRICGNAPNRKKGSYFPLHPDSRRASSDKKNLFKDEIFCLLDPADPGDPQMISFDEKGDAIPAPGFEGWHKKRAKISIERYGLNHLPQLREGRQRVWQECRTLINELSELYSQSEQDPTAADRVRITEKFLQLHSKICPDQPFSATARECLSASGYLWASKIAFSK